MKNKQTGATLIVVLMLLIVITLLGVLAVRQSAVSLGIATNSQVQQLLTQSSDASFFQVADVDQLAINLSQIGMFAQKNKDQDKNKEVVFCYRGDKDVFFDPDSYSVIEWPEGSETLKNDSNGTSGYCRISVTDSVANFFTSGRKAVMTQVAIKYTGETESQKFKYSAEGVDEQRANVLPAKNVKVYSISLMPSLSRASSSEINECLSERLIEVTPPDKSMKDIMPAGQSMSECLEELNVPYSTQVTEFLIEQKYIN